MPASNEVPQAGTTVSPKVTWPVVAGLLLTVAVAVVNGILTAVTPESLTPVLGPLWAVPVATAVSTGLQALVGYLKRDPLRDMTPQLHPVTVVQAGGESATSYAGGDLPASTVKAEQADLPDDYIPATGTRSHRADPADEHPQP